MAVGPGSATDGVALVTGAASGIGAAVVRALQDRGRRVAGLDLRPAADADVPVTADVSDPAAVAHAVAEVGTVDVLVTAAGHYERLPVTEIDDARWQRMLTVHLGGAVNATAAVLPGMLERARGTIVMISSELALGGGGEDAHYAAAKGAVIGFMRSLALEVAPRGVRVNSVAPGPTDTPLLAPDSPWRAPDYLATLPLGRLATPEEVADTVAFLVSEGDFYVGQVLSPNSGAVI